MLLERAGKAWKGKAQVSGSINEIECREGCRKGIGDWGYGDKKKTKIKVTHTQTTSKVVLKPRRQPSRERR